MSELSKLKQQLSDHPDHKLLRQAGVIPDDLRWEPVVKKTMDYFIEDDKCGVVCTLEMYNFEGAKMESSNIRRITYPDMMEEQEAKDAFIDEGWSSKVVGDFETAQITKILKRLA
jgi:hypothetical protein